MDNNNKWDELSLTEKSEIMRQAVANGITDLNEIRQTYNEYADGGSMDNPPNQLPEVEVTAQYPYEQRVIDTMNNSSPEFLERLRNNDRRSIHNPDGTSSTHVLGSADNIVFPLIMDVNGKLIDNRSMPWQSAMRYAIKNNDYIEFPTEGDARYFGEHYKKYFPKFFDNTFADGGKVAHDARYNHVTQIYQSYINQGVNPQTALELTNQKIAEKGWTGWVSGDNKRYSDVNSFTDHTIDQFNRLYPDSLKSNNFNQFFQGIEGGRTKYNPTPNIYRQHLLQTRPGVKKRINEYRRLQGQSPLSLVSPTPTPLPWEESILYKPQLPIEIPTEQPVIAADGGYLFKGGGYIPSASIKRDIANFEGSSMKTNRSFEAEAKDFNKVIPLAIRNKLSQKQLDALYSYGYNVGMGNLKDRVLPTLTAYTQGRAGADDVAASMWASKDMYMRGLQRRRTYERNMFTGNSPVGTRESIVSRAINMDLSGLPTVAKFSGDTPKFQYDLFPPNPTNYGTPIDWSTPEKKVETPTITPKKDNNGLELLALINQIYDSPKQKPLATYTPQRNNSMFVVSVPTSNDTFLDSSWFKKGGYLYGDVPPT